MPFFITLVAEICAMKFFRSLFFLLCFVSLPVFSQEAKIANDSTKVIDSLYREDQFYFSLTYNLVQGSPSGFKQFSFAPCLNFGFLRDIPFSKNRRWSVAPGIGYNYNNIKQFIKENDLFSDNTSATAERIKTRIVSHSIELPLEIRWRNSTPDSHKFWRIYGGFKARYILDAKLKVDYSGVSQSENLKDAINKWQYGAYLATGYNTWNIHLYYGLNPIFKNDSKLTDLNLGFMFYIL